MKPAGPGICDLLGRVRTRQRYKRLVLLLGPNWSKIVIPGMWQRRGILRALKSRGLIQLVRIDEEQGAYFICLTKDGLLLRDQWLRRDVAREYRKGKREAKRKRETDA